MPPSPEITFAVVGMVALCARIEVKTNPVALFDVGIAKPAILGREPLKVRNACPRQRLWI